VDDVPGGEPVALGEFGVARLAAPEQPALVEKVGPAARWIAPSTPPPPSNDEFAALTIASTASVVMSARIARTVTVVMAGAFSPQYGSRP
jgi:hypothetical protein